MANLTFFPLKVWSILYLQKKFILALEYTDLEDYLLANVKTLHVAFLTNVLHSAQASPKIKAKQP